MRPPDRAVSAAGCAPFDGLHGRLTLAIGQAMDAAVAGEMDGVRRACPGPTPAPLHWSVDAVLGELDGQVGADCDEAAVPGVLARWAAVLRLSPVAHPMGGTTQYTGTVDGRGVSVWGVTDRAAFERAAEELARWAPWRRGTGHGGGESGAGGDPRCR